MTASMTEAFEVPAMVSALAIFVAGIINYRSLVRAGDAFFVAEFVGLWAVYLAGNHTLYSFYSVVFTPASAVTIAEVLDIISRKLVKK
ncbi:hypothetical protein DDW07_01040 [Acidilobus sp. SCGC AC-742_E15]|nr:hypothetical protein DDW07_01040 [Acidilobus sp. SCGC AC-742_E15]